VAPELEESYDVIASLRTVRQWPARVASVVAGALIAALALTGCAAGQKAATAVETPVVDGNSVNVGPISVRAASVGAPTQNSWATGSDVPLQMFIINEGTTSDQLVSISTPSAKSVAFYSSVTASGATAGPEADAGTDTASAASSAPSTQDLGQLTGEPASPSSTVTSISLPSGKSVPIGQAPTDQAVVLHGLTSALFPAQTISLTLQFAKAGAVTFPVAVHLTTSPSNPATAPTEASDPDSASG
jgi:copper(I)-binding protein